MCQRYITPSQITIAVHGLASGPRRALHAHQPPRDRSHDHPRQRQEQKQRRDVAEQHVLDHVRGEEIVLAEPVDG